MRKRLIVKLLMLMMASMAFAQIRFPLMAKGKTATIWVDESDHRVAAITAQMLADDVMRVSGGQTMVKKVKSLKKVSGDAVVLVGTLGRSAIIDDLARKGKINVEGIRGKWEAFVHTTIENPTPHIKRAYVIAGSDRRGTAFGVTTLCEEIGVSPWYFWADVTPQHRTEIMLDTKTRVQGEPSVRFRGFFINDERFGGWARWAEETFDKGHGVVGPKTYEKVFELLLRLKGNYLWPAMHSGTQAFNADPENARLADDYAIVMGTSHCEQMLRNNEDEWKKLGIYGDFNYLTNRETILKYWEDRVKTNGRYENTYTIGLRGIHDYPMEGATTNEERIAIMQRAINDQRAILARNIDKDITEIPQVLCTYEEVLDAYHGGLKVPDDVTLLWSDDKQGFMRNLCNPQEMTRKGGAGIYYHLSYHGDPDSWFWLSPLSPALVSAELTKSHEYGARNIWVFNVGDIKPAEKELSLAMELAWDVNSWKPTEAHRFTEYWIRKTFGSEVSDEWCKQLADIQNRYYQLMAYGKEFHTRWLEYTDKEVDERLQAWEEISGKTLELEKEVPESLKAAYYELFTYPIGGAAAMNRYVLLSRRSLVEASKRNPEAIKTAGDAIAAMTVVDAMTKYYNGQLLGGKWDNFFNWHPNWYLDGKKAVMQVADTDLLEKANAMPQEKWILNETVNNVATGKTEFTFESEKEGSMPLWVKARTRINNNNFLPENNEFATITINGKTFRASALPHGNVWHTDTVGPMWSCVGEIPVVKGSNRLLLTDIIPNTRISAIFAGIQPHNYESSSLHRIAARDYVAKHDAGDAELTSITLLGYSDGVTALPFQTPSFEADDSAPWLEYSLPELTDEHLLEIRTLPTLRIYEGRDARYAVSIDGEKPEVFSIHEGDYTSEWRWNVLRGYTRRFVPVKAGARKVRIYLLDPGITLQEVIVTK